MFRLICFVAISVFIFFGKQANAQEIEATVNVLSPNVQMTNKEIFTTLESDIRDFVNSYQWSGLKYELEEKIEASFIFNITSYSGNNFSGNLQVQYSRPIYNSDYNSPLLNFIDNDLSFSYIINQPLNYTPNSHTDNLTSLLAFYCNLVIGLDRASMISGGGEVFFNQMQNIVSNAQSDGSATGWRSFDGNKSRYWLADNLNSPAFETVINVIYQYHRLGLDKMYDPSNQETAKTSIRDGLLALQPVFQKRPNALLLNTFFDAKSDEIVSIFSDGPQIDISTLIPTLKQIDAGRSNKYQELEKR